MENEQKPTLDSINEKIDRMARALVSKGILSNNPENPIFVRRVKTGESSMGATGQPKVEAPAEKGAPPQKDPAVMSQAETKFPEYKDTAKILKELESLGRFGRAEFTRAILSVRKAIQEVVEGPGKKQTAKLDCSERSMANQVGALISGSWAFRHQPTGEIRTDFSPTYLYDYRVMGEFLISLRKTGIFPYKIEEIAAKIKAEKERASKEDMETTSKKRFNVRRAAKR